MPEEEFEGGKEEGEKMQELKESKFLEEGRAQKCLLGVVVMVFYLRKEGCISSLRIKHEQKGE